MAIQAQMYPDNLGLPLGGSQDWLMENIDHNNYNNNINNMNNNNMSNSIVFNGGCGMNGLCYNLQQKLQEQQQFQCQQQYLAQLQNFQQQRNQNQNQSLSCDNGFVFLPTSKSFKNTTTTTTTATTTTTSSDHIPMNFSQGLTAQLEKQRHEIDIYISLQNERLKMALQEQRKHHLATIIKKLEAKAMMMLKQKDEEIAKATNRTMELEEFVRKMDFESQTWRRVAEERVAMVESLNNTLEQVKEQQQQACCNADDAESCCDDNDYPCNTNNRGNEEVTGTGEIMMGGCCRVCKSRNACVLLLPCRHLCCCKSCEAFLDACPLCKSPKKASIEALLS